MLAEFDRALADTAAGAVVRRGGSLRFVGGGEGGERVGVERGIRSRFLVASSGVLISGGMKSSW